MFIHSRVRMYAKEHEILVVVPSAGNGETAYSYEGVEVIGKNPQGVIDTIRSFKPDKILVHFCEPWFIRKVFPFIGDIPVLIWIHLAEATGWYRRLFNLGSYDSPLDFARYVKANTLQLFWLRKLIKFSNRSDRIHFIFVSSWLKRAVETDMFSRVHNFSIVHNPIDENLFRYKPKTADLRKKILVLRTFMSRKYATDIVRDTILSLSRKEFFNELSFSIYGQGRHFDEDTRDLKGFPNIAIHNHFVENRDIPSLHQAHGIFLCPTRQDSQGVSMCEAMCSGLVPVSSRNTAIPEFVEDGRDGLLGNSPEDLAKAIEFLYFNPARYVEISRNAHLNIVAKTGLDQTVKKELEIIDKFPGQFRGKNP